MGLHYETYPFKFDKAKFITSWHPYEEAETRFLNYTTLGVCLAVVVIIIIIVVALSLQSWRSVKRSKELEEESLASRKETKKK